MVLSVEVCSFIQRSYRSIPVSGLLAKCLLAQYGVLYNRGSYNINEMAIRP